LTTESQYNREKGREPSIRGLRITVWDVLGLLGAGMTEEEILDEHPHVADFGLKQVDDIEIFEGERIHCRYNGR
jgi:uncharacterized protein (DUF433 family)